ncbi:hypothetical protein GTP41_23995 [Pseudoduganella sp. DS3]|uniref:Uncharacterized protein n=1 Tax=Pseudoduganella guangdongensis TaxID=2692179 RepID=A0A6N9HN69_9BURK|nr:hypothetical protein [Pseudoduganella guangdongensis]MYN05161.1 hypothetical protein [Pseudoduganella guangdongensis]
MSSNKPDPVAHMSDLHDSEHKFELAMAKQRAETFRWMLFQTTVIVGATAGLLKLFGC